MNFHDDSLKQLDSDSKKSLLNLVKQSKRRKITLVCGAGISVSAGLPTWTNYLQKIVKTFLIHWDFLENENPLYKNLAPRKMSIALFDSGDDFENEYLDPSLTQNLIKEDPLILAQLIKNCIEPANWKYLLRKALYRNNIKVDFNNALLEEICKTVAEANEIFTSILTYNYDDLIESFLSSINFKSSTIISENHYYNHSHFPIYHMHGILPMKGGIESKVYLSEDDYLTDIIQPNSWYNQMHANKLTSTCCLFIGLSFNDPSLKRNLAVHKLNPNDFHYALLTHRDTEVERKKFLLLKNELLRLNVRVIKYPYRENHANPHEDLPIIFSLIRKYILQNNVLHG